jgi:hypothetical protein
MAGHFKRRLDLHLFSAHAHLLLPTHSTSSKMANTPHGGELKDLLVRDAHLHEQLNEEARALKDIFLTEVGFPLTLTCGDDG